MPTLELLFLVYCVMFVMTIFVTAFSFIRLVVSSKENMVVSIFIFFGSVCCTALFAALLSFHIAIT